VIKSRKNRQNTTEFVIILHKEVPVSRTCAVEQCTVLEANAKVSGRCQISDPHRSQTPEPIQCRLKYIARFTNRVDVQNLVRIYSVITVLRMRERSRFRVDFFLTYPCLPSSELQVTVSGAILTLSGSNDVFCNRECFWGLR